MRRPRPQDYDPNYSRQSLEEIDMVGVVPIREKSTPPPVASTTLYTEHVAPALTPELPVVSTTPIDLPLNPQSRVQAATPIQPFSQPAKPPESNIAILQLTEEQIASLREPAYKAQTFRFTNGEIEWLKDVAYQMSKEMKRGKVSQADIIRVALHLFANAKESNQAALLNILQRIK